MDKSKGISARAHGVGIGGDSEGSVVEFETPGQRRRAIRADPNISDGVILMADDDMDNHLIVKCALEEIGFRGVFRSVRDGQELMDYLRSKGRHGYAWTPDLILLDLDMPGMDGRSALREIKSDPSISRIPVAVLTSSTSEEDIGLCGRFKRCSYTRKPVRYGEWTRRLGEILFDSLPSWDPPVPIFENSLNCCEQQ